MPSLTHDLRAGARAVGRSPGFAVAAVAVLALGIGAGTAVFTVVDAVLLRPLPYADPDRLVVLWQTDVEQKAALVEVSLGEIDDWRRQARSFAALGAVTATNFRVNLLGGEEPEQVEGALVLADVLPLLGVEPLVGRGFRPQDDAPGAEPVVLLSHRLWQRRFGGDPDVVGTSLTVDEGPATVVGVLPPDLLLPEGADLWANMGPLNGAEEVRRIRILKGVARLAPGADLASARREMDLLVQRLERQKPHGSKGLRARVVPLAEALWGEARPALWVLAAAVGFLLLVACVNVASLLLARAADREREVAIRAALGAGRGRLIRELLAESAVLAAAGGALGAAVAVWGTRGLVALAPAAVPRLEHAAVDGRALAFALLASLVTVILCGLTPALRASRAEPAAALADGGRTSDGTRRARLRATLVVGEVALSLVLLASAGLLVRSFARFAALDPGFDPEGVLTARIQVSPASYPSPAERAVFLRGLFEKIEALPGVESAAVVQLRPLSDPIGWDFSFTVEGQTAAEQATNPPSNYEAASPRYFETMRIPLVAGRAFTEGDGPEAPPVAIVSRSLAERFWPGRDPIGQRLKVGRPGEMDEPWRTVVGVVGDVRYRSWDSVWMDFYVPYGQWSFQRLDLVVRAAGDLDALVPELRRAVLAADPELPLASVTTMEEAVARAVARPRFVALVLGLFAAAAALLAAVGIYGVVAWSVARRTREIGVRRALGAQGVDVLRLVLGQAAGLTMAGVAIGLGLALAATRAIGGLLYGIGPSDPGTFAMVVAALGAVGIGAGCLPARRALRVEPVVALKTE